MKTIKLTNMQYTLKALFHGAIAFYFIWLSAILPYIEYVPYQDHLTILSLIGVLYSLKSTNNEYTKTGKILNWSTCFLVVSLLGVIGIFMEVIPKLKGVL